MQDRPLMSVTQVLDDDTGIWAGDLCECSIHCGPLDDFLQKYGKKGAIEICSMLEHLKKMTYEYLKKAKQNKENKK